MTYLRGVSAVAAAAVLVLAVAACGGYGGGDDDESEGGSTTIGGMTAQLHGTKDVSNESGKVEIELYDYYFEPTILKGKAGQKVELELKNEGSAAHTFTLAEQSVNKEIQPGDETETEVTFPQSGQLKFVCTFHQSQGMIGALQTSPGSSSPSTTTSKY